MTLNTERLYLRPMTADDTEAMYLICRDEEVGLNAGWEPHHSIEDTIEAMNSFYLCSPHNFGIFLRDEDILIGSGGLMDDPKRDNDAVKTIGYSIGKAYWGKGYITEAARAIIDYGFDTVGAEMISAYCYPDNKASLNVLKKLGFIREGTLCFCERLYNGTVKDNECLYLNKDMWRK